VLTGLAAGTPPDSSNLDEYFMPGLVKKGALLELGPYQVRDRTFNPRDMFEGAWRAGQYRGKQYGISPGVFGPLIKYNKDHFDEAGLPYPPADYKQGGWTWTRMREDAKKLAKRDAAGQLIRAGFGFDARFFSRFSGHFYSYGTQVVDRLDDPTKCVLDEPQNLELIQVLYDMTNGDRTAPPPDWYGHGTGWRVGIPGNNEILFREGKVAISIELQELANTRKVEGLRWDYAPLPRPNNNGKAGNFIGSNVFIGLKATRHPDVIWDWLAALGGVKHAEWKMRDPDLLAVPAWKPLRAEYARMTPPDNIRAYIDLGEYGTTSIMSTEYDELQNAILQGLRPVWNREAPVRQTVQELVRKTNDLLKQAQH
jgi:multiple sugar transport system substrate-binding protein